MGPPFPLFRRSAVQLLPSIHVAHSFVSALTCYRAHRTVGAVTICCASLVAISTLFTKQHYVVDLLAGIVLAAVAYGLFLRTFPRDAIAPLDRRLAPAFAVLTAGLVLVALACFWVAYRLSAPGGD